MPRVAIPEAKVSTILAEWRTGQYTVRELAQRNKVSRASVGNMVKGVEKDCAVILDNGIKYKQALAAQSGQVASIISTMVDKTVERLEYLRHASIQNVQQAMAAKCTEQHEFKARSGTIREAAETVSPKAPTTAIQINNNPITEIERVILNGKTED